MSAADRTEALQDEAAGWVLRLRDPAATARDRAAFERWQARDPRHAAAYQDLAGTAALATEVRAEMRAEGLSSRSQPDRRPRRALGRLVLPLGLATACAALAAVLVLPYLPDSYETAIGETRSVRLRDGSTVSLNAATRVTATFRDSERRLVLEHGQALFDVAKDPARPFRVTAGDRVVQAVGTMFDIDRQGNETAVAVREGVVALSAPAGNDPTAAPIEERSLRLGEGQTVRYAVNAVPGAVQPIPVQEIGAWRQGLLSFRDVPFATMVEALGRYFPGTYRVGDAGLAATKVSISFALEDREATLKAIERLFGVRAVTGAGGVVEFVRGKR